MIKMEKVTFAQEEDTCGRINEITQSLTIERIDVGADEDYFVLQTDRWAFDSIDELVETIKRFTEDEL